MQFKKLIGIVLFCIVLFCFNYALIFGHYAISIHRTSRVWDVSRSAKDSSIEITGDDKIVASKLSAIRTTQSALLSETSRSEACNGIGLQGALRIDLNELELAYWDALNWDPSVSRNDTFLGNSTVVNVTDHEAVYFGQPNCVPDQSVAIIIPFRNRESHLKILLGHLIPILKRQGPRFSIFVVEQVGNEPFNKGRVMNTGFKYATAAGDQNGTPFDCYIFQDVDLLVESDRLLHKCFSETYVHHLSISIDKFQYIPLCCGMTVGGVLGFTREQFDQVNGFPNTFWGWGGEDDAIYVRILSKELRVVRPDVIAGRYTMIKHERDEFNPPNPQRWNALQDARKRVDMDGLADLNTTIVNVEKYQFFTRVFVDVGTA